MRKRRSSVRREEGVLKEEKECRKKRSSVECFVTNGTELISFKEINV